MSVAAADDLSVDATSVVAAAADDPQATVDATTVDAASEPSRCFSHNPAWTKPNWQKRLEELEEKVRTVEQKVRNIQELEEALEQEKQKREDLEMQNLTAVVSIWPWPCPHGRGGGGCCRIYSHCCGRSRGRIIKEMLRSAGLFREDFDSVWGSLASRLFPGPFTRWVPE